MSNVESNNGCSLLWWQRGEVKWDWWLSQIRESWEGSRQYLQNDEANITISSTLAERNLHIHWFHFAIFFFKTYQLRVARMIALEFSHDSYGPVKQKINNVPSAKLTLYRGGILKVPVWCAICLPCCGNLHITSNLSYLSEVIWIKPSVLPWIDP